MITWYSVKHFWWTWFKKRLDEDTVKLIAEMLPPEIWRYLLNTDTKLVDWSAWKILQDTYKRTDEIYYNTEIP
jgi:hypothetical protein